MPLSPEEHQRILDEERARAAARVQAEAELAHRPTVLAPRPAAAPAPATQKKASPLTLGCLGFVVLGVIITIISTLAGGDKGSPAIVYPSPLSSASLFAPPLDSAAAATAAATSAAELAAIYVEGIERETASLATFDPSGFRGSKDAVLLELAMFGALDLRIGEASKHKLSAAQKAKVAKLRQALSRLQGREFPAMRRAWAKHVGAALWENDGTVTTSGGSAKTVTFVAGIFAANANIRDAYIAVSPALRSLRFSRAEFKWYKGESEYTYYRVESLKDTDPATAASME